VTANQREKNRKFREVNNRKFREVNKKRYGYVNGRIEKKID
jgi:hypothetical protein